MVDFENLGRRWNSPISSMEGQPGVEKRGLEKEEFIGAINLGGLFFTRKKKKGVNRKGNKK